jgi:hypothetical protein
MYKEFLMAIGSTDTIPALELELGKTYATASGQHFRMENMCISPPDYFSGVSVAKHGDMPSKLCTAFKKDGTCCLLGKGSPFTLVSLVEE